MKPTLKFAVLAVCASFMLLGCGDSGSDWAGAEAPEAGTPEPARPGNSSGPASGPSHDSNPTGPADPPDPSAPPEDEDLYGEDEDLEVPGDINAPRGSVTASDAEASPEGDGLMQVSIAVKPADPVSSAGQMRLKSQAVDTGTRTYFAAVVCEEGVPCNQHPSLIDVKQVGVAGTKTGVDILFVLDTTKSMGPGLASVRAGIGNFVSGLDEHLNARVGAVTFGDAFDTDDGHADPGSSMLGRVPPGGMDTVRRPSFPFIDAELVDDFGSFLRSGDTHGNDGAGGGDAPENALGATAFGYRNLNWKPGAQKIAIVVTDNCSHTPESFEGAFGEQDYWARWQPPALDEFLGTIRGRMTVHAVMPDKASTNRDTCIDHSDRYMRMEELTGPTGGKYVQWNKDGFELGALAIKEGVTDYVLTFLPRGKKGHVRLVVWAPSEELRARGGYAGQGCWENGFAPADFAVCDEAFFEYDSSSGGD